ncbi:MAG: YccF domain-containing protein [Rhizobium sp.]|nr:YccF domain-containing protein [Rhizobium sp.]
MSLILNLLGVLLGGLFMALGWLIAAIVMAVIIIGIPWARACLNIALFTLWPFGQEAVSRELLYGKEDIGTGALSFIGNVVWFIFAGLWLALGHVTAAILCTLTIIGIPFAVAHLKLAGIALAPVGKAIVFKEVAEEARRQTAEAQLNSLRH